MFAVGPRDGVSVLSAALVRESGTGEECGDAHVKAIEDENVRWQPQGIRIAGEMEGSNEIGLLIGGGRLGELKFKVPPILEASLVRKSLGDGGVDLCNAPGVLDVVTTETIGGKGVAGLRLDAGGRRPAGAIHFKGRVVLSADLPVDLGEKDGGQTLAWDRTNLIGESAESSRVVGEAGSVVGVTEAEVAYKRASSDGGGGNTRTIRHGGGACRKWVGDASFRVTGVYIATSVHSEAICRSIKRIGGSE